MITEQKLREQFKNQAELASRHAHITRRNDVYQSAMHVQERGPVLVEAIITRHGSDREHDGGFIENTNANGADERRTLTRSWQSVMSELRHRGSRRDRLKKVNH